MSQPIPGKRLRKIEVGHWAGDLLLNRPCLKGQRPLLLGGEPLYFRVCRSLRCLVKLCLQRKTALEARVNETRLFASTPPYFDIAIVFYTFVWAGMVRHTSVQSGDQLGQCRTASDVPGR